MTHGLAKPKDETCRCGGRYTQPHFGLWRNKRDHKMCK